MRPLLRGRFPVKRRLAGLLLGLFVLVADQVSKYWVLHGAHLTDGQVLNLLPVLDFVLVWNHGITFGMLNGLGGVGWVVLAIVALAVVSGLALWLWNAEKFVTTLAIGAIAGGAIGNVADRLRYGAVVDFIEAHLGAYSFYVFNVGDSAIVCGVAVLMAESLFRKNPVTAPVGQPPLQQPQGGDRKAP
jgi:lipoprotein signal peptidase